jgi:Undecaprenyl-phosphate glucose phosphotransferase
MLKQKRQLFEFLFMASDLVVVTIAWFVSYWIRFQSDFIEVDKGIPAISHYMSMLPFIWVIWAFVFRWIGLYKPMRGVRRGIEFWLLINAHALALLLLIAATYLFREKSVPYSRLVFAYFGGIALFFSVIQRSILRFILREIRRRGYNLRYILIVGAGKVAGDIATRIRYHRELGMQLVGCLARNDQDKKGPKGVPIIGIYDDLKDILKKAEIDQVVVALPLEDHQMLPEIINQIGDALVDIKIVPDLYQFVSVGGAIEEFEGLPVIGVQGSPLDGVNLYFKRLIDLTVSFISLVIFSPIFLTIAFLIKITSRGPVFYRQERVSFDGTRFSILKFRTMAMDAEADGPKWATNGDERATTLGKILRSMSLDELPQLINVLKGDMSIVGPRPERPVFIEQFRARIPRYMLRHKVPAGMTGWAQVHGWRGDTSIDKRIEYDLYYIENWSILLDIKILFLTLFRGFKTSNL